MSSVLCGTVGTFATRYLHREPGYHRFMRLMLLFAGGIQLVTPAGSLDVTYAGWELVGLTSALLIAFYQNREAPVHHGLWAFGIYRACDVGLLLAALWPCTHRRSDYAALSGAAPWPPGARPRRHIAPRSARSCSCGRHGQVRAVPFRGWLPRAMEGPTPSSAIFYGALSVHAGATCCCAPHRSFDHSPIVARRRDRGGRCSPRCTRRSWARADRHQERPRLRDDDAGQA